MVVISKTAFSSNNRIRKMILKLFLSGFVLLLLIQTFIRSKGSDDVLKSKDLKSNLRKDGISISKDKSSSSIPCEYKSFSDLKDYEAHPQVSESKDGNNRRHAFQPPKDGEINLVCCETTAGPMSIAVHNNWAPLGAARFLDMVKSEYFSSKVALMRCVHNFLCQFGIAGDPKLNKKYRRIRDDPNWLKEGKDFRVNEFGAKRFARGYFAYAGSGKDSRSNQLIVALNDNKLLGGGSPWEVPFGELVGSYSYETLAKISTLYGEKGPTQGLLHKEGSSPHVDEMFPNLDYVTSCAVVDTVDMKEI